MTITSSVLASQKEDALQQKLNASMRKKYSGQRAYLQKKSPEQLIKQALRLDEIEVAARKSRGKILKRLDSSTHLSQGYPLLNQESYAEAIKMLQEKIRGHDNNVCARWISLFGPYVDIEADRKILIMLTDPSAIENYVPEETRKRLKEGYALTSRDRRFVANTKFKMKSLFMQFERMKIAQAQLVSLSKDLAAEFHGRISCPPGAFNGLKSFNGALDKITNRERESDFGDLKDIARMTVEFDNEFDMNMARDKIEGSDEFKQVRQYAKSLKNRYGTSSGGSEQDPHNSGALNSGYQDIKFFLPMDNGIIGELQLNTKGMLVAKEKEHLIYDLMRAAPKGTVDGAGFTVNNPEVLKPVMRKMNDDWFKFVGTKAPMTRQYLITMRIMIARLVKNQGRSLTITKAEVAAMSAVSKLMYAQIGKGHKITKKDAMPPESISMYRRICNYFFP